MLLISINFRSQFVRLPDLTLTPEAMQAGCNKQPAKP
jgi:hypothetical protein